MARDPRRLVRRSVHREGMDDVLPAGLELPFRTQGGVFTTAQALDAGCDGRAIARLVRRGDWVRLRRGAYTTQVKMGGRDLAGQHVLHARAAQLTLRARLAFSHVSAAVLHDLPVYQLDLSEVHVTHPNRSGTSRHESGIWHHTGPIEEQLIVRHGLHTLALARVAFDVGRIAPEVGALVVADAVLARGVTLTQLREQLERGADWPGSRGANAPLVLADGRSESVGESVARWTFHAAQLPPDELQWLVHTDLGIFRTDFAWTSWRVVGEFDGRIKYGQLCRPGETAADVVMRERARELAIERAGWCVVRFTWSEASNLALVRGRLLDARARAQALRLAG